MYYEDLTAEQKSKLTECTTAEDVLALAKDEGVELDDNELEKISGGIYWDSQDPCPKCGAKPTAIQGADGSHFCYKCDAKW